MLFYSRRGYKKHLVGKKERSMEKPEVSREMGIALLLEILKVGGALEEGSVLSLCVPCRGV